MNKYQSFDSYKTNNLDELYDFLNTLKTKLSGYTGQYTVNVQERSNGLMYLNLIGNLEKKES